MSNKSKSRVFSIYRVMDEPGAVVALKEKGYQPIPECSLPDKKLFVFPDSEEGRDASWLWVLEELIPKHEILSKLKQRTPGFTLLRQLGTDWYAVCGGYAAATLESYTDRRFGMKVIARLLEAQHVDHLSQRSLSGSVAQRTDYYRSGYTGSLDLLTFSARIVNGIDGKQTNEVLREYFGEAVFPIIDDKKSVSISGGAGLLIRKNISLTQLETILEKLNSLLSRKSNIEDIEKGFSYVDDKDSKKELTKSLVAELNLIYKNFKKNSDDFCEGDIGLSYHSLDRLARCFSFRLIKDKNSTINLDSFDLYSLLDGLRSLRVRSISDSGLKNLKIEGLAEDLSVEISAANLYTFIYGGISPSGQTFIFFDRQWLSMTEGFQDQIDAGVQELVNRSALQEHDFCEWKYEPTVRPKNNDTVIVDEGSYIDDFVACDSGTRWKLHPEHVRIDKVNYGEFCDCLRRRDEIELIFLKRGIGAILRSLVYQTRDTAMQYIYSSEYRDAVDQLLKARGIPSEVCSTVVPPLKRFIMAAVDFRKKGTNTSVVERMGPLARLEVFLLNKMFSASMSNSQLLFLEIKKGPRQGQVTPPVTPP